jgi:hypothetical protein
MTIYKMGRSIARRVGGLQEPEGEFRGGNNGRDAVYLRGSAV